MSSNLIARSNFNRIGKLFRRLAVAGLCALAWAPAAQAGWTLVDFPRKDVTLRSVAIAGPPVRSPVFAIAGSKGTFATSTDGGRTWRLSTVPGGDALDFRGVALTPGAGAAVLMSAGDGSEGRARLYRKPVRGGTWKLVYATTQKGAFFDTVRFRDTRFGFVLGDPLDGGWFLLRTRNAGKTWTRAVVQGPPILPGEAAFAASNLALMTGPYRQLWVASGGGAWGRVFRSADDGATWQVAETPIAGGPTGGVFGVRFLRPRLIAVGGDHKDEQRPGPNIALSDDGGVTWSVAASAGRLIEGVSGLDLSLSTLIAVGPRGTLVSRDLGLSWTAVDTEAFHAIACAARQCVAVGASGRVAIWQD